MNQILLRFFARFRMQSAKQPALDEPHLPVDGGFGGSNERRRFLRGTTEEVPQFHQLNFVGIDRA